MVDTQYDKSLPLAGISFNGKHSYHDFGATIKEKYFPMPEQVKIIETVPFMDGEYDFSYIAGKPIYNTRRFTIVFNIHGKDQTDIWAKKTEFTSWLVSARGGELTYDGFKNYVFTNVKAEPTDFEYYRRDTGALTVEFSADPYMINGTYYEEITDISASNIETAEFAYLKINTAGYDEYVDAVSDNNLISVTQELVSGTTYRLKWSVTPSTTNEYMLVLATKGTSPSAVLKYTEFGTSEEKTLSPEHTWQTTLESGSKIRIIVVRFKRSDYNPVPINVFYEFSTSPQADKPVAFRGFAITELPYDITTKTKLRVWDGEEEQSLRYFSQALINGGNMLLAGGDGKLSALLPKEVL